MSIIFAIPLFVVPLATQGQNGSKQIDDAYSTVRNRAVAEYGRGDWKHALADFTQAIKLKPDNAEDYNARGLAEYAGRDLKGAIADYTKAIELKADYVEPYANRAVAEYAKDDFYNSRKDEAKAASLKNGLSSSAAGLEAPLSNDIVWATCPASPPSFCAWRDLSRLLSAAPAHEIRVGILGLKRDSCDAYGREVH